MRDAAVDRESHRMGECKTLTQGPPDGPAQMAPIRGGIFALFPPVRGPHAHGPHKRTSPRSARARGVWGAWAPLAEKVAGENTYPENPYLSLAGYSRYRWPG